MASFYETSIPSATITASSSSGYVGATGAAKLLAGTGTGYTNALFCQEITAVSSLTTWDEKIQFLMTSQTTATDLIYTQGASIGQPVQFDQATGTGLNVKHYIGAVPSQLRANYTLTGTSVTRIINIALAG